MAENGGKTPAEICRRLGERRLPRWEELPDLELYMDQVLSLAARYLEEEPRALTASMVNNYVKQGLLPPPVRKRYSRLHLAELLMVCVLKSSLSMSDIAALLSPARRDGQEEALYSAFCALYAEEYAAAAERCAAREEPGPVMLCRAALRSGAEQALARQLSAAEEE